jgi:threonine/homoserine/homoserine lactone efflux protein
VRDLAPFALLGFLLAASPGPVNALAFVRGLRYGVGEALFLVLGADAADILYATLVLLGAAPFVNRPAVQVVLAIGGGIFLAHLSLQNLRGAFGRGEEAGPDAGGPRPLGAAFRQGFTVAFLSPLTIVFWMSVFGGSYAASTARGQHLNPILLILVLLGGAGGWTAIAILLIRFGRRALRGLWYRILVGVLSIALLGFAGSLAWTGARTLLRLLRGPGA